MVGWFVVSSSVIYTSQFRAYTPPELTTLILMGQMSLGEHILWTRALDRYTRAGLPEIFDLQNVRVTVRDYTGQSPHKGHTHSQDRD